jgi:hypothetical protein
LGRLALLGTAVWTACFTLSPHTKERELMDSPANYLHWQFILISVPNLLVIVGMVVLFGVALVVPFPHGGKNDDGRH